MCTLVFDVYMCYMFVIYACDMYMWCMCAIHVCDIWTHVILCEHKFQLCNFQSACLCVKCAIFVELSLSFKNFYSTKSLYSVLVYACKTDVSCSLLICLQEHSKEDLDRWNLVRVSERFRVIALGIPVPRYQGNPLDPPLRSRFQAREIDSIPFSVSEYYINLCI